MTDEFDRILRGTELIKNTKGEQSSHLVTTNYRLRSERALAVGTMAI